MHAVIKIDGVDEALKLNGVELRPATEGVTEPDVLLSAEQALAVVDAWMSAVTAEYRGWTTPEGDYDDWEFQLATVKPGRDTRIMHESWFRTPENDERFATSGFPLVGLTVSAVVDHEHDYIPTAETAHEPFGPLICAECGLSAESDWFATESDLRDARKAAGWSRAVSSTKNAARKALAAYDDPSIPLTGKDGHPLIGSIERAEHVIAALRAVVEVDA